MAAKLEPFWLAQSVPFGALNLFDGTPAVRHLGEAGTAENIEVQGRMVRLHASADCWVVADDTAEVPVDDAPTVPSILVAGGTIEWATCGGVTNISVVSDQADVLVSALFFD